MNQQERDALREKHVARDCDSHDNCPGPVCAWCVLPYPCDVITVLDALEAAERHANNIGDLLAKTEKRLGFRITALQTQVSFWRNEAMEGR
jgi:hypothetical protein